MAKDDKHHMSNVWRYKGGQFIQKSLQRRFKIRTIWRMALAVCKFDQLHRVIRTSEVSGGFQMIQIGDSIV